MTQKAAYFHSANLYLHVCCWNELSVGLVPTIIRLCNKRFHFNWGIRSLEKMCFWADKLQKTCEAWRPPYGFITISIIIKCFWRVTERNLCYVWLLKSVVWISQESEFLRLRSRSTIMSESVIRARDCDKVRRGSTQRQMGNLYWRGALHTNQQRPSLSFSMINVR